jgi:predicted ATPase
VAVAQALEVHFADVVTTEPETLAYHFTEAGLGERATLYWQLAGDFALRRSAVEEAVTHFSSGLRILETLTDKSNTGRRELEIRLGIGTALNIAHGSSHPAVAEHYAHALTLARQFGVDKQLFRALWGTWYTKLTTGQTPVALSLANELVSVAERMKDESLILEACHSRWAASHVSGLIHATLADTERGIALYREDRHRVHAYEYGGHDTAVCAYAHRAVTMWIAGHPEQAAQASTAALTLGQRLGHPPSLAHAAWWSAIVQQLLGKPHACREFAEMAIRIALEQGSKVVVMCPLLLGWSLFQTGDVSEGLQRMQDSISAKRQRGYGWFYCDYELLVFADALLKAGEMDRARHAIENALDYMKVSGNCLFEAEAHRLKAALLASSSVATAREVEGYLLGAIKTAEQQGARMFELRAATTLARLWRDQRRIGEARNLLAPIHGWFTDGFDTIDLKDARALLLELSK